MGLKTHAKVLLVVRHEDGPPRTYCHIGTGNYHAQTARLYTDLGLLTPQPGDRRGPGATSSTSSPATRRTSSTTRLIVAPRDMRRVFEELIRREVEQHEAGGGGRIIAKMNALDDPGIIQELYRASQAGVQIDLIVRGHTPAAAGAAGVQRQHPRDQHRGPLPGARPDLLLPQRRRRRRSSSAAPTGGSAT